MVVTTVKRRSPGEEQAAQLRDAAEAGRADEVAGLLAKGAPADLPDEAGETARDLAATVGDPELDRALGLKP